MPNLIRSQLTILAIFPLLVGGAFMSILEYAPAQAQVSNFERYFVYIDNDDFQTLERVRQIEPSAYIRAYNGRNVIQSGVFSQQSHALKRVEELELNGINGVRIVTFSNTEEKPFVAANDQSRIERVQSQKNAQYYYVIIPGSYKNLPSIAEKIRQKIGESSNVFLRTKPRGVHIAVGPFAQRVEAEQWNNYLRNLGYSNGRVYYGK